MSRSILVGSDFSPEADRALNLAVEVAKALGCALELVHAHEPGTYAMTAPMDVVTFPEESAELVHVRQALDERLAAVAARGVPATDDVLTGEPATAILEKAREKDPLLVVVGSHGRNGLARLLLGSVAERIVRNAHRPVLVVPKAS